MFVQNGDFRTTALIAGGAVLLGAFVFREVNGLAQPSVQSPPPVVQRVGTPTATLMPATPTSTPVPASPTALPTEAPATKTMAAISFQATVARATQSAIEYQATVTAIGIKQADELAQQTRVAHEGDLAATLKEKEIAAKESESNEANMRAMLGYGVIPLMFVGLLVFFGARAYFLARAKAMEAEAKIKESEARQKEAEAKAAIEQRRLLEVQMAVRSKVEQKVGQMPFVSPLPDRIPGNGHGNGEKTKL